MQKDKNLILNTLASTNYIVLNKTLITQLGLETAGYLSILVDEYRYFSATNRLTENDEFTITREKITKDTLISAKVQRKIEESLKKKGIISVVKKGLPSQNFYKININKLIELLNISATSEEETEQQVIAKGNQQWLQKGTTAGYKREQHSYNNNINNNYNNNIIKEVRKKRILDDQDFDLLLENENEFEKIFTDLIRKYPRLTIEFVKDKIEQLKEWHSNAPKSKKKTDLKKFISVTISRDYPNFIRTLREEIYLQKAENSKPNLSYQVQNKLIEKAEEDELDRNLDNLFNNPYLKFK